MILYYICANVISFIAYYFDKQYALNHTYRIKESTLLTFSILGGCFGGYLSMLLNKHKTKKYKFHIINFISILIHLYLLISGTLI